MTCAWNSVTSWGLLGLLFDGRPRPHPIQFRRSSPPGCWSLRGGRTPLAHTLHTHRQTDSSPLPPLPSPICTGYFFLSGRGTENSFFFATGKTNNRPPKDRDHVWIQARCRHRQRCCCRCCWPPSPPPWPPPTRCRNWATPPSTRSWRGWTPRWSVPSRRNLFDWGGGGEKSHGGFAYSSLLFLFYYLGR